MTIIKYAGHSLSYHPRESGDPIVFNPKWDPRFREGDEEKQGVTDHRERGPQNEMPGLWPGIA